VRGRGNELD